MFKQLNEKTNAILALVTFVLQIIGTSNNSPVEYSMVISKRQNLFF